jgi:alpha-L-fucosidase
LLLAACHTDSDSAKVNADRLWQNFGMGPTDAQADWMRLQYGMFIHFGPWTYSGTGDGKFPAAEVKPDRLDAREWARLAAEAGMRYGVLTAKHVDGFCLWPSGHTTYSIAGRDLVAEFVEAFRAEGLKVGLYYALLDRSCPVYDDDAAYAEYVRRQVSELLGYGEIVELWFDGAWDKDHPTRDWPHDPAWTPGGERWQWAELYEHIHRLQPRCLVLQNSSSDRPGVPNYLPVDARTSEHFDFVWQDRLCAPPADPVFGGRFLPLEYCTTLTPGWFWAPPCYSHPPAEAIAGWRRRAAAGGSNLLLNVGPDRSGRIPEYHRPFLLEAERKCAR